MTTKIYIEGRLIDLFKDETMELNSSIANTDDITKINSDYTKTFTVPASDNNNTIFKHFYNADIDNTFDARTKKDAYIEMDGFPFRTGKIRLEKVSVKKGKASSYTINFWGNLVNFKQLIKEDELNSLDLSIYNHEFNSDNVKTGLTTGLFDGDVIYTLMSKKQYYYNSGSDNTVTDLLVNIAQEGGANTGVKWNELRPSVRLLGLIELIESKYGFNFSRDFFGRSEFTNLYLWANNDKEIINTTLTTVQIDFVSKGDIEDIAGLEVNIADNYYVALATNTRLTIEITPSSGYENVVYSVLRKLDGDDWGGAENLTGPTRTPFRTDRDSKKHTFFVRTGVEFKFTAKLIAYQYVTNITKEATQAEQTIEGDLIVINNLPNIKIIDFLKGLFNMFKLVAIPQDNGDIYINNIDSYYTEGTLRDISNYIDYDSYDVERGKINNQIDFKYQEPTTILNKQFKINTGIAYGDELLSLADSDGVPLDGDKLELTLPFEQVVYERLPDLETGQLTNIQYALITDDKLEPVNPKPVIFYNNNIQLGTTNLGFINDINVQENINSTINTPAHTLGLDAPDFSLCWGIEFSTWDYVGVTGTLFYNYWRSYVSAIFNIKKRNFKFKAFLPVWLLTKLQLNDILFIKERYYRINDFTVDLLTGEATLNLINSFEGNFGIFSPSQTEVYLNYKEQSYTVYVSNGSVMNITLEDLGDGTAWATATQSGSSIVITVEENALIANRHLFISVDNGGSKTFQIYLNQDNKIVSFDSTEITFDDDILTFDAE